MQPNAISLYEHFVWKYIYELFVWKFLYGTVCLERDRNVTQRDRSVTERDRSVTEMCFPVGVCGDLLRSYRRRSTQLVEKRRFL